jgi:DNA-binding GntR family transcriptional regulator
MLDLVREGLIGPLRNKGFRVTDVSERDLDDITEVRLLLEPPAVGEAARRATARDLAALQPLAERIVEAARDGDLARYLEADRAFHVALLALAGNRLLVDVVADLRGRTRLQGLAALASGGGLEESAREYLVLLDLLRGGDADGAVALTRRHL